MMRSASFSVRDVLQTNQNHPISKPFEVRVVLLYQAGGVTLHLFKLYVALFPVREPKPRQLYYQRDIDLGGVWSPSLLPIHHFASEHWKHTRSGAPRRPTGKQDEVLS